VSLACEIKFCAPAGALLLRQSWLALQAFVPHPPFLNWSWIETWIALLPASSMLWTFTCKRDSETIGIGIAMESDGTRLRGLLSLRQLSMNESGEEGLDSITSEYCGLLVRTEDASAVYRSLFESMRRVDRRWDEVVFSSTPHAPFISASLPSGWRIRVAKQRPAYFVDLETVRSKGAGYEGALPSRKRARIARIRRSYEARGRVELVHARNRAERMSFLETLRALHQEYWTSRGRTGAFASPFFDEFHRRLLSRDDCDSFVQLSMILCGGETVGVHYHLISNCATHYYQSGYRYGLLDGSDHPGFLCHAVMVNDASASGLRLYDFLVGDQRYKRDLATSAVTLSWVHVARPSIRASFEHYVRCLAGLRELAFKHTPRPIKIEPAAREP